MSCLMRSTEIIVAITVIVALAGMFAAGYATGRIKELKRCRDELSALRKDRLVLDHMLETAAAGLPWRKN